MLYNISTISIYIVVEWSTLLLHIEDVPGSNLGPETGHPDRPFVIFLSLPGKFWGRVP
jgi:hypothetical protein